MLLQKCKKKNDVLKFLLNLIDIFIDIFIHIQKKIDLKKTLRACSHANS